MGPGSYKTRPLRIALKVHCLPRDREPAFHFRADRDVFHVLPKCVGEKPVQSVPAIIADTLSQQAGADTQFDALFHLELLFTCFSRRDQKIPIAKKSGNRKGVSYLSLDRLVPV
jgi:hypothetical protein